MGMSWGLVSEATAKESHMNHGRMLAHFLARGMSKDEAEREARQARINMSGNGQGGLFAARSASQRAKIRARNGR